MSSIFILKPLSESSSRLKLWRFMVKRLRLRYGILLARTLTSAYYLGALIVYDISRTTIDSVTRWLEELKTHSDTTVVRMLTGNKYDLENIRAVSVEDGKKLAEKEGLFFMETSALDSTNVKTAWEIYNNVSRKVLNSESYKAELSLNRITLPNDGSDGSKQNQSKYSCCS